MVQGWSSWQVQTAWVCGIPTPLCSTPLYGRCGTEDLVLSVRYCQCALPALGIRCPRAPVVVSLKYADRDRTRGGGMATVYKAAQLLAL